MPWFLGGMRGWNLFPYGIIPLLVWSSFWKGLALWHAAKRNETGWFVALFVINTIGILEMCYLLFVVHLFSSNPPQTKKLKKR